MRKKAENSMNTPIFSLLGYDGKLVYKKIVEATNGFASVHYIAKGGHSVVYRADLGNNQTFAIKKLQQIYKGNLQSYNYPLRFAITSNYPSRFLETFRNRRNI